tara:strand:+ start:592 stop:1389 length:798 start_codon:yes stop_codon:yes gene_type:complete
MKNNKRIAISFIGTGSYFNFFPKYYETIDQYFIPECEKHFFVFTDGELDGEIPDNITLIPSEENFVPKNSDYSSDNWHNLMYNTIGGLGRFKTLKKIKKDISKFDWYVFIDADYYCCSENINYDEFFNDEKPLFGVQHPTFCDQWSRFTGGDLPFERNKKSLSCVTKEEEIDNVYLQGCLWGGKPSRVLELIDDIDKRINEDTSNKIISRAHDESHLNRYRYDFINDFHILEPCFAASGYYPRSEFSFKPRMVHSPEDKHETLKS